VITAYKEPSGVGVRVDANGYAGYAPPPQFDPLLAKVICSTAAGGSFAATVARTRRALAEFHVGSLPTNLALLDRLLAHEQVIGADARTTLTSEEPELVRSMAPAARWISPHRLLKAAADEPTNMAYIRNCPSSPPLICPATTECEPFHNRKVSAQNIKANDRPVSIAFIRKRLSAVRKLRITAAS